MPPEGLNQNTPPALNPDPSSEVRALNATISYVRDETKTAIKDLKDDAKEQKSYLMLGFFILGVMVATMMIMLGGMVYGVFLDQNTHAAQLDADTQTLIHDYGKGK
jgi:hypothetical protein